MLKKKFYKLSMQDDSSMSDFLFTIKELLVQITGVGDVIRVEDVVLIVLNTLFDFYKNFVQGVSAQETLPSFDQLMSKLL